MRNAFLTLGVIILLSSSAFALQSLADVAKKTNEERDTKRAAAAKELDAQPTKTYSNKDLKAVPPRAIETGVLADTPVPAVTESDPKETPSSRTVKKDEAYWKDRMRALQRALDDHRSQLRASVSLYDAVSSDATDSRGAHSVVAHGRLIDAAAEMSRLTAVVKNDRRAIVDLEEEARRANVPPGWLRP